jgi:hypothetical protein
MMAEPQGAILANPMDEDDPIDAHEDDEVITRTWAELIRQHPRSFVEIEG